MRLSSRYSTMPADRRPRSATAGPLGEVLHQIGDRQAAVYLELGVAPRLRPAPARRCEMSVPRMRSPSPSSIGKVLADQHGDRVRLLPGGAGRAPDRQAAARRRSARSARAGSSCAAPRTGGRRGRTWSRWWSSPRPPCGAGRSSSGVRSSAMQLSERAEALASRASVESRDSTRYSLPRRARSPSAGEPDRERSRSPPHRCVMTTVLSTAARVGSPDDLRRDPVERQHPSARPAFATKPGMPQTTERRLVLHHDPARRARESPRRRGGRPAPCP